MKEAKEVETQTVVKQDVKEKKTQTSKVKKCFCTKDFQQHGVHLFEDKVI